MEQGCDDRNENLNKLSNLPLPKKTFVTIRKPNDVVTNGTDDNNINDTVDLFRNVIKEINYWKSKNDIHFPEPVIPDIRFQHLKRGNTLFTEKDNFSNSHLTRACLNGSKVFRRGKETNSIETDNTAGEDKELSLSFLLHQNLLESIKTNSDSNGINEKMISQCGLTNNYDMSPTNNINYLKSHHSDTKQQNEHYFITKQEDSKTIDLKHFQPAFVSTPKREINNVNLKQQSRVAKCFSDIDRHKHVRRKQKIYKPNINKNISPVQVKRSVSARLFSAINDSCTTFVKSVKSIFKPKNKSDKQKTVINENNVTDVNNFTCSYSFTNYMRKRDAVMTNGTNTESNFTMFSSEIGNFNSCKTCNNTMILKNKLANDEYLKKTVKKLKFGINLFGCDFKVLV